MKPEFSLAHLTIIGVAPSDAVHVAAEAGYDYVSLRFIPLHTAHEPEYLPQDKAMLRATRRALADTGVRMLDLELARILPDVEPRSYLPAMEAAAELGARHVISSAWTNRRDDRDFVVEKFGEICDLAAPLGMSVSLEFPSFSRLTNLAEASDIIRAAERPNGGLLVDTLYVHFSRVPLADLAAIPREWFHFAHLCDGPVKIPTTLEGLTHYARDERSYVGEGAIDIAAILAAMPQVPYSIESPNVARVKEFGYAEHARHCLETARRYFERHLPLAAE